MPQIITYTNIENNSLQINQFPNHSLNQDNQKATPSNQFQQYPYQQQPQQTQLSNQSQNKSVMSLEECQKLAMEMKSTSINIDGNGV